MTREEAIAIIRKEYLCVDRDCDIEKSCGKCDLMMPSKEPILQAYKMAIKALEQEDAIEKIRAEVESINPWALRYAPSEDKDARPQIVAHVKNHVLEIIDKYKAESEE